jgi:hypothetical protein
VRTENIKCPNIHPDINYKPKLVSDVIPPTELKTKKGLFPTHKFYQNFVLLPLPVSLQQNFKKTSFTYRSPCHECDCPGFLSQAEGVFLTYLALNISNHTPCSFSIVHNHLLRKHTFITSRSTNHKPPNSLG